MGRRDPSCFSPVAALGGMLLCACAYTPATDQPLSLKEPTNMAMVEASEAQPPLSAEDIGARFLKLIGGLSSRQDLSLERVQEATGLMLQPSSNGSFFGHVQPLEDGWSYGFTFIPEAPSIKKGVGLDFNSSAGRYADMASICAPDFEHYRRALKSMGFDESPIPGEIGQIDEWRYYRGDITISIIPQNAVPGDGSRLCVKSIGTLN